MKLDQRGFSLVEFILVVVVIGFLVLLIVNLPTSIASITKSRHTSLARDIASKQVDYLRKQGYANLSSGISSFSDSNLSNLPYATATYQIEDCPVSICSASEPIKQVKVQVSWQEAGQPETVELITLVGDGGVGQ